MPKEAAIEIRTSNLHAWTPTLWPLCYRNLAFKAFCLLILSLPWLQRAGFSTGCSCEKSILQALKNRFFSALFLWNSRKPGFAKKTIRLLKIVFFRAALVKLRQAWLFKKRNQALKTCFFPRYSLELRKARLCKKTTFRALFFFRMPLVKSANSTSLPCLSFQIARMHAIHN